MAPSPGTAPPQVAGSDQSSPPVHCEGTRRDSNSSSDNERERRRALPHQCERRECKTIDSLFSGKARIFSWSTKRDQIPLYIPGGGLSNKIRTARGGAKAKNTLRPPPPRHPWTYCKTVDVSTSFATYSYPNLPHQLAPPLIVTRNATYFWRNERIQPKVFRQYNRGFCDRCHGMPVDHWCHHARVAVFGKVALSTPTQNA